ncbi:MAG: non-homologous end-joining DNA ligase [Candidatus Acidiferrales bacterium]
MPTPKASKQQPANKLAIAISNPAKVFWPKEGYAKLDLAEYYSAIFGKLQPYVRDRMLTLERCPDGMGGQCFYQKEKPQGMPPDTPTINIKHAGGSKESTNYIVGGSIVTQLALVNLGCIPVHVMGSRASSQRKPDWVCFDLDPASGKFADAARAARYLKEILDVLKLDSYVKTSGSRGIHIFLPIRPGPDADEVLAFAEEFCAKVAHSKPDELTVEHSIKARGDRVYLDPFRNGFGQTVVAPYSVRRRDKAPFSKPLAWSEVKENLDPSDFNLGNYQQRLQGKDPWTDFFENRQSLKKATQALKKI